MKKFKQFADYMNEQINESVRSSLLSKLLASNDQDTKGYIKDLYKKDGIALSELTEEEVFELPNVWSLADLNAYMKRGEFYHYSKSNRTIQGIKNRLIAVDIYNNKIISGFLYDPKKNEITIDYTVEKIKNFKQFFDFYSDEIGKTIKFYLILLKEGQQVDAIDKKELEKRLTHVYQRESDSLKKQIEKQIADLDKYVTTLLDSMFKSTFKLNYSLSESSFEVKVNNMFACSFDVYFETNSRNYEGITSTTPIENIKLFISKGTAGNLDVFKEPERFESYRLFTVFGEAILKESREIIKLKESVIKRKQIYKDFSEFTFELNGKKYKRSFNGFVEVEDNE